MQNVGHIKLQSLVNVNVIITEENVRLLYQMGQGLHIHTKSLVMFKLSYEVFPTAMNHYFEV